MTFRFVIIMYECTTSGSTSHYAVLKGLNPSSWPRLRIWDRLLVRTAHYKCTNVILKTSWSDILGKSLCFSISKQSLNNTCWMLIFNNFPRVSYMKCTSFNTEILGKSSQLQKEICLVDLLFDHKLRISKFATWSIKHIISNSFINDIFWEILLAKLNEFFSCSNIYLHTICGEAGYVNINVKHHVALHSLIKLNLVTWSTSCTSYIYM